MNLIKIHRVASKLKMYRVPVIPKIIELLIFLIYNSRVPATVKIGSGTSFAYFGIGCVIHKSTEIGRQCTIGQGITIGGRGKREGVPKLGDNVYLGAGSRILGPITIGDNVIIGPNAVVIENVPSNSIAVGVPARIVKTNIEDITNYL